MVEAFHRAEADVFEQIKTAEIGSADALHAELKALQRLKGAFASIINDGVAVVTPRRSQYGA